MVLAWLGLCPLGGGFGQPCPQVGTGLRNEADPDDFTDRDDLKYVATEVTGVCAGRPQIVFYFKMKCSFYMFCFWGK